MDWTEKHRPQSLHDLVGNGPSVKKLHDWAKQWETGVPKKRAVILAGPPGTGKTSAALALARDMGWQAIELNASDARNATTIKRVAGAGAVHQTFATDGSYHAVGEEQGRKLIILDEADNLYERLSGENAAGGGSNLSDKGGKVQIIATIRETKQPIVLIVNDLYALTKGSGSSLNSLAETLKWTKVNVRSIPKALGEICRKEGIQAHPDVLQALATRAEGDLRAAVRDLQSICTGRTELGRDALASLGPRDTTASQFDIIRHILKGSDIQRVKRETMNSDSTPEDMILWVDENMPKEYQDPEDLVRGYEMLSRADVFLGRTRSTQNYRLWAYAGDLSTVGVMAVRQNEYRGFKPFGFPQWLSKMSRSRGARQVKDKLAGHLGTETHQSKRKARRYQVEPFTAIFELDPEFQVQQTFRMDLGDDEVALLLDAKAKDKRILEIREAVALLIEEEGPKAREFGWDEKKPRVAPKGTVSLDSIAEKPAAPAAPKEPKAKVDKPEAKEAPPEPDAADDKKKSGDGQSTLFGF